MAVDTAAWDGNRAMTECETAADYNKICAGKKAGDPALRSSHALPHHYLSKAPTPNAGGVRAALQRFSQTQGLTNKAQARAHLEAHMSAIQSASSGLFHRDDGLIEARMAVTNWEVRHSGRPDEAFTIRGYPIVFDELSLNLGGFREKIAPEAFDEILATEPDVHFVWDHDTRYVGARTKNGTLKLTKDTVGVFMDAQVGNYSWAKDLRTALERGDINQGSFAMHVGEDDWEVSEDESVIRTVRKVDGLYDVTVTAQGAYPQTSLAAVRSLMEAAKEQGRLATGAALVADPAEAERGESESHVGSVEATEEFMRWKEARIKKAAATRSTLAKLAEKLGKLE